MTEQENYKQIIRVLNTDLKGERPVYMALQKIKGVGFMFSNMLLRLANINHTRKAGSLTADEVAVLEKIARDPLSNGAPEWMINRRRDYETNADMHLIGQDIKFVVENDKKRLKLSRCKTHA